MRFLLDHLTLIVAVAAAIWVAYASGCAIRASLNRPPPAGLGEDESRAAAVRDKIRRTIADRRENPLPPVQSPSAGERPAFGLDRPWWRRIRPIDPFGGPFRWLGQRLRRLFHREPRA
jgi:hypothetical protein